MHVLIITPCLNAAKTINRTISSVATQAGDFSLHYHIQDGGSQDGTQAILAHWQQLITEQQLPIACQKITFSWQSTADQGMYDAISKAFLAHPLAEQDWMAWINADDFLLQGALSYLLAVDQQHSYIHWLIPGFATIANQGLVTRHVARPISTAVIQQGLCDGVHWDFIQQEGSFFKHSLWCKIETEVDFACYKLAGDWNLWRRFAHYTEAYQSNFALAVFNRIPEQLSQKARHQYLAEIEASCPISTRRQAFEQLSATAQYAHQLDSQWDSVSLSIKEIDLSSKILAHLKTLQPLQNDKFHKAHNPPTTERLDNHSSALRQGSLIYYDAHWQYPAITEQHAFLQMRRYHLLSSKTVYFAFPWATLIDLLLNQQRLNPSKQQLLQILKNQLKHASSLIKPSEQVISVCQHVMLLQFQKLFADAGISHLFWSHTVKNQATLPDYPNIQLHPFPLYPVQTIQGIAAPESVKEKKYLFSFVGAVDNPYYLSKVRQFIVSELANNPNGLVISREDWHYNNVVYFQQIIEKHPPPVTFQQDHLENEFRDALSNSLFALCPSGSGANSIRLWEAMAYGSIPVILSEHYLPPGNWELWQEAALFFPETRESIQALPEQLAEIAQDKALLAKKHQALRQLAKLYGVDFFIYDIQNLIVQLSKETVVTANLDPNTLTWLSDLKSLIDQLKNTSIKINPLN